MRVVITTVGEIAPGEGRAFEAQGRALAVFNVEGRFHVIDNACPHRGGPLAEGRVDGRIVRCPWHGWRWDVTTGANANNPASAVTSYPVTVADDSVLVDLPVPSEGTARSDVI